MSKRLTRRRLSFAVQLALAAGAMLGTAQLLADTAELADFPAIMSLSSLNGTNGFRLDGITGGDNTGYSVAKAGDVNGDGIADFVIGAHGALAGPGSTYVVFGHTGSSAASIKLSALDGSNGFRIDGITVDDNSGVSVGGGGDINGDGFDDIVIGANQSDYGRPGRAFVVFGHSGAFTPVLSASALNGSNGFRLDGAAAGDHAGVAVAIVGDMNGDGFDDIAVGSPYAKVGGGYSVGRAYVVFGHSGSFGSSLNLSTVNGSNGFQLEGSGFSVLGSALARAGDINGDGFDDIVVGAFKNSAGVHYGGTSYVVFGHSGAFASPLSVTGLNGSNGFRIPGATYGAYSGWSVSGAGDLNGDGFDDVAIGQPIVSGYPTYDLSGRSYVIFGHSGVFSSSISLSSLNGTNGFRLDGPGKAGSSGDRVAAAGDVNGDGVDDLMIGAVGSVFAGGNSGSTYIVFGRQGSYPATFGLSTLNGSNGFRIDGAAAHDTSGRGIAGVGDVNGDGLDDMLIGAEATPLQTWVGSAYVVFGVLQDKIFSNGFEGP